MRVMWKFIIALTGIAMTAGLITGAVGLMGKNKKDKILY